MKIIGIVGSAAKQSYNRKLLQFIQKNNQDLFDLDIVDIDQVPLFNQDEPELTESGAVHSITRRILQADGVIISTPEHNHTVPAALNSLLEWLSFKIHPLRGKAVAIIGASYLDQGTSRSQLHLRQILEAPGVDAMIMPGNEFLLGDCQSAFDADGNLKDEGTIQYLRTVLDKFTKFVTVTKALQEPPIFEPEDLTAEKGTDSTIAGVDMTDPNWVEIAAEKVGAVSGDTYVKLDRGLLTVNQLNWFLKTIPLELTYADENNQFIYYNRTKPGKEMFASRYEEQVGNPLSVVHPPRTYKNVSWVISQLRSGNMDGVHVHVPIHKDHYVVHNYVAMHDEEGKYRGINEHVLDLQPIIDWYLEQTGQKLVGNTDSNSGASSMGGAWGTSETTTDTDSGASESDSTEKVLSDVDSAASELPTEPAKTEKADATSSASTADTEETQTVEPKTDTSSGASES